VFTVLVYAEGDLENSSTFPSEELARAFAEGAAYGARLYGAGSFTTYVLPCDENVMRADGRPESEIVYP
jgi:hypothetical protein